MKLSMMKIAERYGDDSGDEFGVYADFRRGDIQIQAQAGVAVFPVDKLLWFIDALNRVKEELKCQDK